jgi:MSHA biogenesis protein MshQ
LLALNIPVRAEYYDGEDFITNAEDVCSTYRASNMTLSDVTGADSLVPGDTTVSSPVSVTTLVNGQFDPANPVILDAPGAGKTGSLDVLFDLSVATGSDQEWLRYDWDNDDLMNDGPFDDDPISRATWGIFSGSDEFIYIREPW